jgi:hypothetical protein
MILKRAIPAFAFSVLFNFAPACAQNKTDFWKTLSQVSFAKSKDSNGFEIDRPVFGPELRLFDKKIITLSGYILPLNELNGKKFFMLSALPFSTCYFCGGAGPETVVEVEPKKAITFSTRKIYLRGTLVLNATDVDHHMYILKSATLVE